MGSPAVEIVPAGLSVEQAAQYLGVSRTHLYQLMKDGQVVAKRFGRRVIVPRAQLDRLLETDQPAPSL